MNRSTMVTLPPRSSLSRRFWCGFPLVLLLLAFVVFGVCLAAQAVTPAPDGGYPNRNTAEGDGALLNLSSGLDNTAIGFQALITNTTGEANTALGSGALRSNTDGIENVAIGYLSLVGNTTGLDNTAVGSGTLSNSTTASNNTAVGAQALSSNSTGELNTATGAGALANNFAGNYNTATGCEAMYFGLGSNNTADGFLALGNSTSSSTASNNTAIGSQALASTTANYNTAIGQGSLYHDTTGSNNVALGSNAGGNLTTGSNNIDIGAAVVGAAGEANTIRIGRQGTQKATFVAGIAGVAVSGRQVVVSSNGKLGIATSSARFKQAIKPMDSASEAILRLKPVSFRYKEEIDPDGMPQFGLIAEEVAKVNPDLVVRDDNGEIYTVRYEAVNAMLLNEFLKEHRTVEELKATAARQEATIAQQQKEIKALTAGLKEQASQIQKVSRQLEVSNTAPQMVANNQ